MKTLAFLMSVCVCSVTLAVLPNRASDEIDIREAVYRYQFRKNGSAQQMDAKRFFLAIRSFPFWTDPHDALIRSFAGSRPPVGKHSECNRSVEGVFDKKTGERGLVFYTDEVKQTSDTEAEVDGGYFEDGESSSINTYYLKKIEGRWQVIEDVLRAIS